MQMVIKDNPDFKVYKEFVLQNTTIPVYDAYDLTKVNYGSICTLYFSELNKDSSDFKFGVIIGLESDLEIRWRKEKCFDIIKESSLFDKINKDFPNWLENNPVTGWLVGEDMVKRINNVNYKAPYHFSFPSIDQFKGIIGDLCKTFNHQKVDLLGYSKINGTNASLIFTGNEVIKQSKEKTITVHDQYGFAHHIEYNIDAVKEWGEHIKKCYNLNYPFVVAGEWAGKGIIKNSSVSEVMPFLGIFLLGEINTNVLKENGDNEVNWLVPDKRSVSNQYLRFYDIREFGVWKVTFNPSIPETTQKELAEITKSVESKCPVAEFFGIKSGLGEGVVWHPYAKDMDVEDNIKNGGSISLYFKVKGSKHSNTKVRTLASPNPERLESINKFIEYVLTENRFEQAVRETGEISKQNMGKFLSWIAKDVMKEESDTLKASGLDWDKVSKPITSTAMSWYKSKI